MLLHTMPSLLSLDCQIATNMMSLSHCLFYPQLKGPVKECMISFLLLFSLPCPYCLMLLIGCLDVPVLICSVARYAVLYTRLGRSPCSDTVLVSNVVLMSLILTSLSKDCACCLFLSFSAESQL